MALATTKGRAFALKKLADRREKFKDLKKIDNSSFYAGSPMYFNCIGCNAQLVEPEGYITRNKFCIECSAMNAMGWLE